MLTCSGCGFRASTAFALCPRCGRRLPRPCITCGFACDADFAFCPKCGSVQAPAAGRGEAAGTPSATVEQTAMPAAMKPDGTDPETDRRHVTVLFADLSGFTTLSERLDPEHIRAFQNALFEVLARAVARYGGFVEKFIGDAVLAVFGAPVAHEDDPDRACHAALNMLEGSGALSEKWTERLGQPVAQRANCLPQSAQW